MLPWSSDEKGSPLTWRKRQASAPNAPSMRWLRKNGILRLTRPFEQAMT
jgi:hypothetical protein